MVLNRVTGSVILAGILFGIAQGKIADGTCRKRPFPFTMADVKQCDKYWLCVDGVITPQLCPDGLVYDYTAHSCHLPHRVNCRGRPKLQDPDPTDMCPRQNGNFIIDDSCDSYISCENGIGNVVNCSTNLVFDPNQGVCEFPDIANRTGCLAEQLLEFRCPFAGGEDAVLPYGDHARIPKPNDCRGFFMCLKSGQPRLGGCQLGLVYNPETQRCDKPENVPGCEDYYKPKDEARKE